MQTLKIDIEDNKVDILLNLIKNLKEDVIKGYTLTPSNDKRIEEDPYYYERQKDLEELRKDIKKGNMKTYDFDKSMDELINELES